MSGKTEKERVLPEGWHPFLLHELSSLKIANGIFNDPKKVGSGYKLVNVINLYAEPFIKTDELKLLNASKSEFEKFRLSKGDLLFTRSSLKLEGIAHCNMYQSSDADVIFECHTMRIRPNEDIVLPKYLYFFCRSNIARRYFMKHAQTTTMTTIDQSGIGGLPVFVPSLPEQKTIASLLETWDTAIEKTEALIEAKEKRFKWLVRKIYKQAENLNTEKISLSKCMQPTLHIQGRTDAIIAAVGKKGIRDRTEIYSKELSKNYNKNRLVYQDEIAFGLASDCIVYGINFSQETYSVSPAYKTFKIVNCESTFFKYLLDVNNAKLSLKYLITSARQGKSIDFDGFLEEKFVFPAFEEQKRIANLLNTTQKEIDLLKQIAERYRTQKRGLMQRLLTGEWRVKI